MIDEILKHVQLNQKWYAPIIYTLHISVLAFVYWMNRVYNQAMNILPGMYPCQTLKGDLFWETISSSKPMWGPVVQWTPNDPFWELISRPIANCPSKLHGQPTQQQIVSSTPSQHYPRSVSSFPSSHPPTICPQQSLFPVGSFLVSIPSS